MLSRIISFSVKNKFIVGLFTIALIGWGVYSLLNISIDAVPDITNNQVQIVTSSPSLAAQEVEQFITYPIELEMANVQDVEEIRSISRYGLSVVTVVFKENVPVLDARQLVGQQLQLAVQEIPEGYGEPSLMPITTGLGEVFQYTLKIEEGYEGVYSAMELRTIHDWVVKRQLNGIPGIVEISSFGGFLKQYVVAVNPQILSSYNISLLDINEALQNNNQNTGGSYIQKGPYAYYIRAVGLIANINDIENIVVTTRENIPILISDIADVSLGSPPRFGAMTQDGKGEAVGGITLMIKGGNSSKVIKEVKSRIVQIQEKLPEGITIEAYLDRSELVNKVIHTVRNNLLEGGLIVILLLVLLLGNFRAGLIVASIIPLSMLFAFGMMKVFGITATVMSLGAIDFGLIVDATVIIIESILFHIEQRKRKLNAAEMDSLVEGTILKIRNSAAFGAIIILIVYLPILSLTGIEGKMFRPMALTVSFAILGALILSFTYVPAVASLFLSKKVTQKKTFADKLMDFLYNSYKPVFLVALKFKKLVLGGAVLLLLATILVFNNLGAEFLPDLDEGDLAMQMTIPLGSSLNESIKASTKAEKVLLDNFPEVKTVVSKIGTAEIPTDPMAIEDADVMIILKPKSDWVSARNREELVDKMKEKLQVIAGASFEFTQPIQLRFNELLTGAKADVVVKIYGEDLGVLYDKAVEASKYITPIQGAADVKVERIEGSPQLVIDYNRVQIARYGLNIVDINSMIRTALAGKNVGYIFEGERKFDLVVRLQEEYRTSLINFENLSIKTPAGSQIPLKEVANISFKESPMQVSRDNTHRRISIGINVRNRDVQSLVEEIQSELDENLILPMGYYISYGGKFENLQSAMARLKIVVPIALVLIFILLFFAFGSAKYAGIILTTIPLSIIGGVFALWTRGLPFSISAGIGFIALFGVAVLDGIVLINHLHELKIQGIQNLHRRLLIATKNRLRPVLVTSAVASLGFLPMALSTSSGAEVQRPLATVVIGGIISSTFLTMIVLPIVYYYFETGFKVLRRNRNFSTLILMLFISGSLYAQSPIPPIEVEVSLEQALEISYQNNSLINSAVLKVEQAELMKQSTFNLGKTELDYTYGQINSSIQDYQWTVRQNFGNPFKIPALSKYYKGEISKYQLELEIHKLDMTYRLNLLNQEWNALETKYRLIDTVLANFEEILRIAELQYSSGEINSFVKLSMDNLYKDMMLYRNDISGKMDANTQQLQNIMESKDTPYRFKYFNIQKEFLGLDQELVDSFLIYSTQMQSKEADIVLSKQQYSVGKAEYLPELYIGYFNQQIDGNTGFSGFETGISIPLWFYSQHKENQSAKRNIQIAENAKDRQHTQISNKLDEQFSLLERHNSALRYYEESALVSARKLTTTAIKLFENQQISYYEFLQSVRNATLTHIEYIDKLLEYNSIVITIKYLTETL